MTEGRAAVCSALPAGVDWTPVDVALARLRGRLGPVTEAEAVALWAAQGRVLAEPVLALRDSPPAANAAVDGYAYAWSGAGAVDLALADGRAAAGHVWTGRLAPGTALRILTGAEIPEGADSVALEEACVVEGGRLRFTAPGRAGENRRPAGEDARAGETVLEAGRRLGPGEIARAASVGMGRLTVRRRLRVALLSTGDELALPGEDPARAGVFDANRPMLSACLAGFGHETLDLGLARDAEGAVRRALDLGAETADAILTTGGASAGDEDHLSRLLNAEGQMETWRVAMKPGRPLAIGAWRGVPVFALPGNPVAAFVCALVFARPALGVLAGAVWAEPRGVALPAGFAKRKKAGRREYLRARIDAEGRAEVYPSEGSGLVGGLAWASGLVELPDRALEITPGDPVRYLPFSEFGI